MPQKLWDSGTWDSGYWDSGTASLVDKIMNAKVALNLANLKPREQLDKFKKGIDGCTGNSDITTPNPSLADCQEAYDAADAQLKAIALEEEKLKSMRTVRDQLMAVAMSKYGSLGSCVENKSGDNPAVITKAGFDVAGAVTPVPHVVVRVMNLVLTIGDHDGSVDASWNRDKFAKSYEVQTATAADGPYASNQVATKSSCTIAGQVSGTHLWVRVRSVGSDGTAEWSSPVVITVP